MKKALRIIKYLVLIGILIAIFIEVDVINFGMKEKPKKSDCIMVLGCQVKGANPSPFLQERLKEVCSVKKIKIKTKKKRTFNI